MGFKSVNFGGTTYPFTSIDAYNTVYFNTTTNPFDFLFRIPMWNTARQGLNSYYHILCLDVRCPFAYYFDYTNQICSECSYDCMSCLNNYCSSCGIGRLIDGKCSLIPGCINFVQNDDNSQTCLTCYDSQFILKAGIC